MRASNPSPRPHSIRGFALLEVMLAVVVLAIGLLALAALQAATIRSSAAAKAQTTAISLTKDQVERMQGFATLNGYRDLGPKAKPSVNDVLDSTSGSGSLGGVDYKRWWDVERYVYNGTGFVNVGTALVTATNSALTAANANYVPGNEFKRIRVNVAWVDATGTEQTVSMEDAIAAINPAESSRIIGGGSTGPRGPQVRISNPQNEAGVIPVAIGDGSDTAATNPKPKVLNSNAGTTFDVLTYTSNDGSAAVVARQRVDTTVVGCTCDFGNPAAEPAYRPSYWNGFRYTAPKTAAYTPPAGPATGVTQSALCTQCCRDHHDPAGDAATASGAKFDPRRNSHDHARLVSGVLTNVTAGRYREACRVVRVDGFNRVAADLYGDHFSLIPTQDNARSPLPLASTTPPTGYEKFVIDQLTLRFLGQGPSAYNTPLSAATNTGLENDPLVALNIAPANTPNDRINISKPLAPATDTRYLHSRSLYVDHLEAEAKAVIASARANCTGSQTTCVLKVLPFTTINTTNLANWTATNVNPTTATPAVIKVFNNDATPFGFTGNGDVPVRGYVQALSGINGQTATANTAFGPSNAALALSPQIDLEDAPALTDQQLFEIASSTPSTSSGFTVNLASTDTQFFVAGGFPALSYLVGPESGPCSGAANPVSCDPSSVLGGNADVLVTGYNRTAATTVQVNNRCSNNNNDTTPMPYKLEYDVTSATVTTGVTSPRNATSIVEIDPNTFKVLPATGETTRLRFLSILEGDVVQINFGNPTYFCPVNYDTYAVPGDCGGKLPNFSTTFAVCPVGFTP